MLCDPYIYTVASSTAQKKTNAWPFNMASFYRHILPWRLLCKRNQTKWNRICLKTEQNATAWLSKTANKRNVNYCFTEEWFRKYIFDAYCRYYSKLLPICLVACKWYWLQSSKHADSNVLVLIHSALKWQCTGLRRCSVQWYVLVLVWEITGMTWGFGWCMYFHCLLTSVTWQPSQPCFLPALALYPHSVMSLKCSRAVLQILPHVQCMWFVHNFLTAPRYSTAPVHVAVTHTHWECSQ